MSVEAKVKSIIAEQLGVGEDEIKAESAFIEDSAPTRSTSSSW